MLLISLIIAVSLIGLGAAIYLFFGLKKQKVEDEKARIIANYIEAGALVFLFKEFKILGVVAILLTIIALALPALGWPIALAFMVGVIISGAAAFLGVKVATMANVRTAEGCKADLQQGLRLAFSASALMALGTAGAGLLVGVIFNFIFNDPQIIYGFLFGVSLVTLFIRVGGGIFTKSADVSADVVGKLEARIPEDDLRNPAVVADNAGDLVGDFIGVGADLFESYIGSILVTLVLGFFFFPFFGSSAMLLPLLLSAAGLAVSVLMIFAIKILKVDLFKVLNKMFWLASLILIIISFFIIKYTVDSTGIFWSFLFGLISGIVICLITEHYTSENKKPVKKLAEASQSGSSVNIIFGLSLGFYSTISIAVVELLTLYGAYKFGGVYGVAIAGIGMISLFALALAMNTFGPMVDNAAGILEMSGAGLGTRKNMKKLDASGNTRAAMGKGLAVSAAAFLSLVLLFSLANIFNLSSVNLISIKVIIGLFIGGLMPFIFSAISLKAIGRGAAKIINEVHRQIREMPGLMGGTEEPDYNKCIKIATNESLKKMVVLGLIAIVVPVLVGTRLGAESLIGMLAGSIVVGFLLSVFMANAGGAWDNAKKIIESESARERTRETFQAAIVGDTVGDPFKDAVGPAINVLIKLMAIISLIIIPFLVLK